MMKDVKVRVKKPIALGLSLALGLTLLIFVFMLLFNITDYGITIASFGATIFMILSKSYVSKRKIFGAYLIAVFIGYLFSMITVDYLNVALAAMFSIVIMTLLQFQHAPAIGMTVAMVLNKFSFWTDFVILFCIFMIIGMTLLFKMFLTDPEKILNFVDIEEEKIKWNFRRKEVPEYIRVRT